MKIDTFEAAMHWEGANNIKLDPDCVTPAAKQDPLRLGQRAACSLRPPPRLLTTREVCPDVSPVTYRPL